MKSVNFEALFGASPNPYVLLDPTFVIVEMNDAYLQATMRERSELRGRGLFDAFPADPASPGYRQLRLSLQRVVSERVRDHLPLIQYDIPLPGGRGFEERYWSATHTPLFDDAGALAYILQHTVDVSELYRLRNLARSAAPAGATSPLVETEIFRRAQAVQEASHALETERHHLRGLFEQAPGFMAVVTGPHYVFEMANSAFHALVGHRPLIGKALREALPEVEDQGFISLLDRVQKSGQPFVGRGVRVLLHRRPGEPAEERHVDFIYQPIAGADGRVSGIFVQGNDVTEQKRAGDALRESEERFRLVAESAPVMLWMGDQFGKCVYLNRAQRDFWGVPESDVSTFDWNTTLHPEDRDALFAPFAKGMQEQAPFAVEARYRRADGEFRLVHTDARPRFGPGGEFFGMIGVNVDVTDTRSIEAALREETRLLGVVNRTGASLAAEMNLERIVQGVTDAGVELTRAQFGAFFYNVLDEKGESYMLYALSGVPREAFAKFPMPRATTIFRPTFNGEGVVRSDDILRDPRYGLSEPYRGMPKGHLPVRSYLAVPVIARSGEVLGGLFFGHAAPGMFKPEHETMLLGIAGQAATAVDNARLFQAAENEIASRTQAEDQLRQLNETLEARVAAEIAERQNAEAALQQAQKMEAIGKLTGGVAHDFNNLLQVVSGNLQLLAKDIAGNDRAERRVANALAGISRGAKLANQLLAFGRRQPLEPKVVNIGRFVAGMEDMLRRTLGETVEIETVISGGLWNTFIDPTQIENAVLNLAINSRDAMDGDGKLTIELGNAFLDEAYARGHAEVVPGQYVVLAVTDTGSGMTPEVLAQAFEPFFSTKPEGKGTGLGLSMVYGFVKQSGGHVKIYGEVGHGTTVKLYLPRARQNEDVVAAVIDRGAVAGGTETILVTEDDEEVRATVVDLLTDLGYRVLKAKDAASALTVIESGAPIDLLFTDIVMPGALKSPELARKARERIPSLAVLFTSGYTENAVVHGGRLDAGVDLLSKPYTREALAWKIRQVLTATRQRAAAPAAPAATPEPTGGGAPRALRILLVEDDELIRLSTAELLMGLGYVVVEAGTGEEALAALRAGGADIMVTDLGLPGMDGRALANAVRELLPDIGIVFATGDAQLPAVSGRGKTELLRKPFDAGDIEAAVRAVRG